MGAQLRVQTRYLDLPQFMLRKNILKLKQYFPELSGWDKRTDFDIAPKKPLAFSKIFRTLHHDQEEGNWLELIVAGLRKYCFTFWKWITLLATNHHLSPGKRKWGQSMFLYLFLIFFFRIYWESFRIEHVLAHICCGNWRWRYQKNACCYDRHWQCQKKGANIDITSWL